MRARLWLVWVTISAVTLGVCGDGDTSGGSSAAAQVYPLTDRDRNNLYALPPKVTSEQLEAMSKIRAWRPYQAFGSAYVLANKPGRRSASKPMCSNGKVWRYGECRCPYLKEWNEEQNKCVCAYGTYQDINGLCRSYL